MGGLKGVEKGLSRFESFALATRKRPLRSKPGLRLENEQPRDSSSPSSILYHSVIARHNKMEEQDIRPRLPPRPVNLPRDRLNVTYDLLPADMASPKAIEEKEPRKRVFYTSVGMSLIQFGLFHFPAIGATATLLVLHILQFYWNPRTNELSALLFAAKVHESLILASLFHIVYYHIRRGLLSTHGIPFGYLVSAFQLNSPFYLVSSSFLAPFFRYRPTTIRSLGLVALLLVTFVLAALVGASSGIVMLPKLGWWRMPLEETRFSNFARGKDFSAVVISPLDRLYPLAIDAESVPPNCGDTRIPNQLCPYYNFAHPQSAAWGWFADMGSISGVVNLTTSYRQDKSVSLQNEFVLDLSAATCPIDEVVNLLSFKGRRWTQEPVRLTVAVHDHTNAPVALKQPRVVIQCSDKPGGPDGLITTDEPYTFHMLRKFYPDFRFTVSEATLAPAFAAHRAGDTFGFLDLSAHLPFAVSAAYWAKPGVMGGNISLCLVDARWVESDMWSVPSASGSQALHTVKLMNETLEYAKTTQPIIRLGPAWLAALNGTLEESKLGTARTTGGTFDLLLDFLNDNYSLYSLAKALTVYMTDAVSMVPGLHAVRWVGPAPDGPWELDQGERSSAQRVSDLAPYALVELRYDHTAYQYNFQGTATKLAWGVLLLHVLLALVHLVVVLAQRGWASSAWAQLGDLVALAVNTSPTALLRNTGVGVSQWAVWRLTAYVREVDGGGRVELVLKDGAGVGKGEGHDIGPVTSQYRKYG